ncbi:MAG: TRAP transporter substrate-binding protein DctP [Spirochaetaceae bacterium]|jgi:TRAP-type C4-dicarboxylate transport system substrate-binding protein|nr:TRAP transporter substrate-binding protein DctP [Spirochaetaceae bacterium]
MIGKKLAPCSLIILTLLFLIASPHVLYGQRQRKLTINLASSLPRNSPWGRTLDRIAAEWSRTTNGEVNLHILHQYPGSEGDYLMKLRQDKIQAAIFTSIALNSVTPEVMALSIPFLIRNNAELDAVLQEVRPIFNSRIEEAGYINMVLVKAGWVKIFSRSPVYTPDDLRRLKVGTNPDEQEIIDAFRTMGFQMVRVATTDVAQRLNSGMIDAIYQSPISVSAFQLYRVAKHMSTVNLAPFMGGVLMSKTAWARIPPQYQEPLREIVRQAGAEIENSFQRGEEEAIATMRQNGVSINQASPQQEQEWYREITRYIPDLVNRNVFHREMYERIQGILQDYRGRHP